MWLLLLACVAPPEHIPGRNTERVAMERTIAAQPRGITVPIVAGAPYVGERVDVLVRDPDWRPLAQDARVLAVDLPRVTLVLPDAPAIELAGIAASGWDISLRDHTAKEEPP